MILTRIPLIVITVVALNACGNSPDKSAGTTQSAPLVATTSIWADIASHVACGEAVAAIVPAGADPHSFEPSLQDRELLDSAATVIANGSDLEESLVDLLDTIAANGVNVVQMTTHVDLLTVDPEHGDQHSDEQHSDDQRSDEAPDDGHGHSDVDGSDPHIWQDPTRIAGALDVIASAVIAAGRDADAIHECTDVYRAELEDLDADITVILEPIPSARRVLVTSHDALGYFADRYGFTIVGTVLPSTSTIAETSAAQLAGLADAISDHAVPAIFVEEFESSADAKALASRLDVAIIPLVTDSLAADGAASTYVGLLRSNAEAIADALG